MDGALEVEGQKMSPRSVGPGNTDAGYAKVSD